MKEHILRLMPGEDLIVSLDKYCQKYQIEAAYIGTCVGSLAKVSFRKGYNQMLVSLEGPFEIVSLVGTLSKGGIHLHAAVSDEHFQVRGGHIVVGCTVKSTAEIVVIELEEYQLTRSKDEISGYKELRITTVTKSCTRE